MDSHIRHREDNHSLTFGIGVWLLWRARNKRLFEQVTETYKEVAHRCDYWVALITSSWKTGQLGREVRSLTRQTQSIRWRPSDEGYFTLSTDESLRSPTKLAAAGGVIHIDTGRFVKAFTANLGSCSITRAKMSAIVDSLQLAWTLGIRRIQVQLDSMAAIAILAKVIDPGRKASMVAKTSGSCGTQVSSLVSIPGEGSRNKRKFRADPTTVDAEVITPSPQNECASYQFSAEKFEATAVHGLTTACDLCGVSQDYTDGLKLNLDLSSPVSSSEVLPSQPREEPALEESHDPDWSHITESQLEELALSNLNGVLKSAIKRIVACGFTEEVATKAILRSTVCDGCKDTLSNIVDNTLEFLQNGKEIDPSIEQCFDDLQQLQKYILADLVCLLREVRPSFSTGDAMWCLLISDMNLSHACAMDGDAMISGTADGTSNVASCTPPETQIKPKSEGPELNDTIPVTKPKKSHKEGSTSAFDPVEKFFNIAGPSQSHVMEEKFTVTRKVHSGATMREFILTQKSLHLGKGYRSYGSKGSLRSGKLSGLGNLVLDKRMKSISDSTSVNIKNSSIRLSMVVGAYNPQDGGNQSLPINSGMSSSVSFSLEAPSAASLSPKTNIPPIVPPTNGLPAVPPASAKPGVSTADTELSLSLPAKSSSSLDSVNGQNVATMLLDNPTIPWVAQDKKDEMIVKLLPRVRVLQNQLQEWTEWVNQKVMQAARRLSKDKAELKLLRQEKEEVERLKKEKQTLEENTMKKLTEMENALRKASEQVERARSTVRRLEVENAALRLEMEAAKLHAAESATSCQDVSKREKKTLIKLQSQEKQKGLLQEELGTEKRKVSILLHDLEVAKQKQEQQEGRRQQEEKSNEELLLQARETRKERDRIEGSTKSEEDMMKLKAAKSLQKYKDNIEKLEKEISKLRLKADSSKIAALRRGIDHGIKSNPAQKERWTNYVSELARDVSEYSEKGGVERERECVMCLSEAMSVVFLPCAHQVVCTSCNELHEKKGMKDCPSCRSHIQRRIRVRNGRS
ncbi:Putative E3 ubiquitin-protein ligase RF298 [Linum grandiflorum]